MTKLRSAYTKTKKKKRVKFDELGNFRGKYRSKFVCFLGDLARQKVGLSQLNWKKVSEQHRDLLWEEITRYFHVDASRRDFVMNKLGSLLRNFRRKIYERDIEPNLNNPTKLSKITKRFRTIIQDQTHWDKFVTYTQTNEFNAISAETKAARAKSIYPHRMGRGGYAFVRENLVKNNEIQPYEEPSRCLLWCKGHENKEGEIEDDNIKSIATALIKAGKVKLLPGTNVMTLVLGKENGGRIKGVGIGVTKNRYFNLLRAKASSNNKELAQLKLQLEIERREKEEKEKKLKDMTEHMAHETNTLNLVLAHLHARGDVIPNLTYPTSVQPSSDASGSDAAIQKLNQLPGEVTSQGNMGGSDAEKQMATHLLGGSQSAPIPKRSKQSTKESIPKVNSQENMGGSQTAPIPNRTKQSTKKSVPKVQVKISRNKGVPIKVPQPKTPETILPKDTQEFKCTLSHIELKNVVARGRVYISSQPQKVHGAPLQADCYVVSIDQVVKENAFLPDENPEHTLVGEAVNSFVAWPKDMLTFLDKTVDVEKIAQELKKNATVDVENNADVHVAKKCRKSTITLQQLQAGKNVKQTRSKKTSPKLGARKREELSMGGNGVDIFFCEKRSPKFFILAVIHGGDDGED
ncbi:hypothetical protein LXL04_030785 [Taraxacum kok-saghyz]